MIDTFGSELRGGQPYPDQKELLKAYGRRERRISKRSGHRVGKTTTLAWIIVHHLVFRFPQKTAVTAPTERQLYNALGPEVKKWLSKLPYGLDRLFEVTKDRIVLKSAPDESFVTFIVSRAEVPEAIAGVHSDWSLIIVDEGSGVPDPVFEAGAGSMAGENAMTIIAGNPVRTSGFFFDTHHKLRHLWWTQHVSSDGHPNVTPDFVEDMAARYGRDSNAFRVRVLGEFPLGEADKVIPFEHIESALARDVAPTPVRPIWGLDVGRSLFRDSSALAKRKGNVLLEPTRTWNYTDPMQTVGLVIDEWNNTPPLHRPSAINVDVIGEGAGVVYRLMEKGLPAYAINVSEVGALKEPDRYANLRAELYYTARDWFSRKDSRINGVSKDGAAWKDEALAAELGEPEMKYRSSGKILVESKDDMKKRNVPSPNRADAFVLTFATDAVSSRSDGQHFAHNAPLPSRGVVYE